MLSTFVRPGRVLDFFHLFLAHGSPKSSPICQVILNLPAQDKIQACEGVFPSCPHGLCHRMKLCRVEVCLHKSFVTYRRDTPFWPSICAALAGRCMKRHRMGKINTSGHTLQLWGTDTRHRARRMSSISPPACHILNRALKWIACYVFRNEWTN